MKTTRQSARAEAAAAEIARLPRQSATARVEAAEREIARLKIVISSAAFSLRHALECIEAMPGSELSFALAKFLSRRAGELEAEAAG